MLRIEIHKQLRATPEPENEGRPEPGRRPPHFANGGLTRAVVELVFEVGKEALKVAGGPLVEVTELQSRLQPAGLRQLAQASEHRISRHGENPRRNRLRVFGYRLRVGKRLLAGGAHGGLRPGEHDVDLGLSFRGAGLLPGLGGRSSPIANILRLEDKH